MLSYHRNIYRLVFAGLFAALIFVATFLLKLPSLVTLGYIHLGDGFIFIASAILPAPLAAATAAVGAGLADLSGGYISYIFGTVIIKAATSLCFTSKKGRFFCPRNFVALVLALLINVGGYYLYGSVVILGGDFVTCLAEIPANIVQSLAGCVIFILIGFVFDRNKKLSELTSKLN